MTPQAAAPAGSVPKARYQAAITRYLVERAPYARRALLLSRLRLLTFLPALALFILALSRGPLFPLMIAAGTLFVLFGVLVVLDARVDERLQWLDALLLVAQRGIARIDRDWDALPAAEPPPGVAAAGHPYAADLDLFGRASLFQLLGPAATATGARQLAGWLLAGSGRDELEARQEAVSGLTPAGEWREQFAAHGVAAAAARVGDVERFMAWAEGEPFLGRYQRWLQVTVIGLTAAIALLFALFQLDLTESALWMVPAAIGVVLSFGLAARVGVWLERAGAGQRALGRYGPLLAHAVTVPHSAPRLAALHQRLTADGRDAPACMRRLHRILGYGELRHSAGILHFPIQALTLWDFHVVFALERWRVRVGRHVRSWIEALAELDAMTVLAGVGADNPAWSRPALGQEAIISGTALGHPLLAEDRRVTNDVRVGPHGTLLLVTGSNMSGKSTLLRSIGLNVVLAQAGSVVAAERFSLPLCDLQTSLRVQDSLELGLSYFMAALARLKGVVDAAQQERPGRVLLYLLDEILQGTNSIERALAVRAVARHLLQAGAIGVMTTHDLSLAAEEPLASAAELVHFTEHVSDTGEMRFDYRLQPGLATSRNALRLMKLIGIEP
ncbi:MAG: DNA mismatch repair protein MutS [Vicinamibacterales bacterium]